MYWYCVYNVHLNEAYIEWKSLKIFHFLNCNRLLLLLLIMHSINFIFRLMNIELTLHCSYIESSILYYLNLWKICTPLLLTSLLRLISINICVTSVNVNSHTVWYALIVIMQFYDSIFVSGKQWKFSNPIRKIVCVLLCYFDIFVINKCD